MDFNRFLLLGNTHSARFEAWKQQDLSVSVLARSSTLYHSLFLYPMAGRVLQVLDHAAIYLLIAGTYTPFLLFYSDTWQNKASSIGFGEFGGMRCQGARFEGSGSGHLKEPAASLTQDVLFVYAFLFCLRKRLFFKNLVSWFPQVHSVTFAIICSFQEYCICIGWGWCC